AVRYDPCEPRLIYEWAKRGKTQWPPVALFTSLARKRGNAVKAPLNVQDWALSGPGTALDGEGPPVVRRRASCRQLPGARAAQALKMGAIPAEEARMRLRSSAASGVNSCASSTANSKRR